MDMTAAIKAGRLDVTKAVFKLSRPADSSECPNGDCGILCGSDSGCAGELFYLQLVGTGKFCQETFLPKQCSL